VLPRHRLLVSVGETSVPVIDDDQFVVLRAGDAVLDLMDKRRLRTAGQLIGGVVALHVAQASGQRKHRHQQQHPDPDHTPLTPPPSLQREHETSPVCGPQTLAQQGEVNRPPTVDNPHYSRG
jgi:hypothetical protein